MTNWKEIVASTALNPCGSFNVAGLEVRESAAKVDAFPSALTVPPAPAPKLVVTETPTTVPVTSPKPPVVPVPVPTPAAPVPTAVTVMSPKLPVVPVPVPVPAAVHVPTAHEPLTTKRMIDPIVLGIERRDPLYVSASPRTRHLMECEEAQRVEGQLNDLYSTQGGRSRGWTKVGLEGMIKPRCASGGDHRELDSAKKGFPWQLIGDDKVISAFLDFVCVSKAIRLAVWFADTKIIQVYPAADNLALVTTGTALPLYNVTCKGEVRIGSENCKDLYSMAEGYTIMPPLSVMKSLSSLSLSELKSVSEKLGMPELDGNKSERVAKIAAYKLKQRLLGL